jgi:hypothetical protein
MRQRFDVTENLEKFCKILGTKQTQSKTVKLLNLSETRKMVRTFESYIQYKL